MKPEEAIEILEEVKELDDTMYAYNPAYMNSLDMAITALKEIQQYLEIGTVEECREAVGKQNPKKCVEDSCPDHTHYKCPSCGKIQKTKYNDSTFGCILNNCSNCGQALADENLEGMEDDA